MTSVIIAAEEAESQNFISDSRHQDAPQLLQEELLIHKIFTATIDQSVKAADFHRGLHWLSSQERSSVSVCLDSGAGSQ